ncbi:hypothetical protein J4E93_000653 [Alternaria ventricosa]|uniref:uncharacterized protein n=1 Tax=Alternaria ventricosa TaxID=1187951 RepID=UPI0020C3AE89|nr:uncharacterized protein J4E93_000653 [Alternaria ventricosa]KAI4655937.1 hypothetical protein J4E93_000653 [Alternaria ventricosa]
MAPRKTLRGDSKSMVNFDPSQFITIIVGEDPDQRQFLIHKTYICERSEFFRRAMNGNWTESKERIVRLPEDDPAAFEVYINLVYTGLLLTKNTDEKRTEDTIGDELDKLCKLYVLGEKLQDKAAKNSALQALLVVSQEQDTEGRMYVPRNNAVYDMYHGTCSGSLGRRLVVDIWTTIDTEHISDGATELPKEFLVELAVALSSEISKYKSGVDKLPNKSNYMEKMD